MQIGLLIETLDRLPEVASWGFDYAEITPWMLGPDAEDRAAEEAARERLLASGVPAPTMCGFLPDPQRLGLMVVGPFVDSERLRSYTTRLFDRMQRAGVEILVFGSGTARTAPDGFPMDRAQAQLKEFVTLCSDLAQPRNVQIVLEPQNYTDTNMLHTVPQALSLANEVDRPNVKVMADFFHICLNEEPLEDLVAAGPALAHAHIAEPGRGRPQTTPADHAAFFATLERAGFDGHVTKTGPLPAYASEAEAAAALKSLARQRAMRG